jgi:hypothetical protein
MKNLNIGLDFYNFIKKKIVSCSKMYDNIFLCLLLTSEKDKDKKAVKFHNYNTEFPFHTAVAKGKFAAAISTVRSLSDSKRINNDTMFPFVGPNHLCNYLRLAAKYTRSLKTQTILDPCPVLSDCAKDRFIVAYLKSNSVSWKYDQEMNAIATVLCDLVTYVKLRK